MKLEKFEDAARAHGHARPSFSNQAAPYNYFDQQGVVIFPHHFHEHLEFLYIVTGKASIECGSTTTTASAGDLVVVNSNELHYGISLSSNLYYYALIADISLAAQPIRGCC
jgi:quercetin dioxygenase-like cupin family protein